MRISKNEALLLRELGERYMAYASLPAQKEKLNLWKALNRLSMERPMVVIDQVPWQELEALDPDALQLKIIHPYWRGVEQNLRRSIYQWENFPADMVLEPYITIPAEVCDSGFGIVPEATDESGYTNAQTHVFRPLVA